MENKDDVVTRGMLEESMKRLKTELTAEITAAVTTAFTAAITDAVDGLAGLINRSFIELEKWMATKDDVRALEGRMGSLERKVDGLERKVDTLEHKVDDVDMHLSAYATQWNQDFDGHEIRLRTLEKRRT